MIYHRHDLGQLLQSFAPNGIGVEVGVQEGKYSEILLDLWQSGTLYCVDRWLYDPSYIDSANKNQEEQENLYQSTIQRLSKFKERCHLIRKDSIEASKDFKDESLDFVYIDADHSYEGCMKNLKAWYPKVKKGKVFAGHDYLNANFSDTIFGVKQAVDEFFGDRITDIKVIPCINGWHTWLVIK